MTTTPIYHGSTKTGKALCESYLNNKNDKVTDQLDMVTCEECKFIQSNNKEVDEKKLLINIIASLIGNNQDIQMKELVGDSLSILQIKIESKNMGKVIGRRGILIKSIRTIVRSISAKHKHKIILELIASD
jgi:uncharacterized protein